MMTVEVDGITYVSAAEIARQLGVVRQTIWRWRQRGIIPTGRRFRDRQVLYTRREVTLILRHANKLEPVSTESRAATGAAHEKSRG